MNFLIIRKEKSLGSCKGIAVSVAKNLREKETKQIYCKMSKKDNAE